MWAKKKVTSSLSLISLVFFLQLVGCFKEDSLKQFEEAQEKQRKGLYLEALNDFDRVIKRFKGQDIALKSAQKAAEISIFQLKDYKKSIRFLKYQVLFSQDESERRKAQEDIAGFYFTHLNQYQQSVIEYNRLIEVTEDNNLRSFYNLQIARSYFFLKNFFQAKIEIKKILAEKKLKESLRYQTLFLSGNIAMTEKETDKAIKVFSSLLEKYPEKAQSDSVALQLAICYEEKENFVRAIEILDGMKKEYKTPAFIDSKIRKLKVRQSFLPGARGLRK